MLSKGSAFPEKLAYYYAFLLVFVFGAIDYFTGPRLGVSILYFLPIYLTVTRVGYQAGLIISLVASAVHFASDGLNGEDLRTLTWNTLVRFGVFYGFCILLSHQKTTEQKLVKSQRQLTHQLEFQKLITHLSTRFINLPCEFVDDAIHFALRQIGEFENVDRCHIFLFSDDGIHMENTHEWCARGIAPQISQYRNAHRSDFSWAVNLFERGECLYVPRVSDLPAEAASELRKFELLGIRSLICVPLVCAGITRGFMGFDSVRVERAWSHETITLLRIVSDVFANALLRKEAQAALEQGEAHYRELFENNPNPMWVFDLDTLAFLAVNDAATNLLGYSRDEFLSMTIKDIRPAEDVPKLLSMLKIVPPVFGSFSAKHQRKDGSFIDVELNGHNITWEGTAARVVSVFDVTERNHALQLLIASEAKFRSLVETTSDAIIIADSSGTILAWNPAAAKMFGLDENFKSKHLFELIPERYRTSRKLGLARYLSKSRSAGKVNTIEVKALRRDGTEFPVELSLASWKVNDATYFAGIIRDITERTAFERALRASELKYRTLVENMSEGLIVADHDDIIMFVNERLCEIFGYSVDELIGQKTRLTIIYEEDWNVLLQKNRLRAEGISDRYEVRGRKKTGEVLWLEISGAPMRDPAGDIIGSIAVITDISERKQIEKELLEISGREQRRIGQDLHDGLGQHLTGLGFLCKALQQKLAARKAEEENLSSQILALVQQAMNQSHNLAKLIRPVPVDSGGLVEALAEMAANTQRVFQVECRYSCSENATIDSSVEEHVYRIAQEAVNNAIKHAKPTLISIGLITDNGTTSLSVSDNGSGMDSHGGSSGGFGLRIMSYRAAMIGGKLDIQRHATGGTIVTCMWPTSPSH